MRRHIVKFMLAMYMNSTVWERLDEETRGAIGKGAGEFVDSLRHSGELVCTYALGDSSKSKTVQAKDGAPAVIDGPHIVSDDFLCGFYVVETKTKKRAYELASLMPEVTTPAFAIEVRPVMFEAVG